jgi:predicted dehydrogenase
MHTRRCSRRRFLSYGCKVTAGAFAAPLLLKPGVLAAAGAPGAGDRVIVGWIGTGGRGQQLMRQLPEDAQIAALCDCFVTRSEEAKARHKASWDIYQDYRKILERKDIDAFVIATTDHGRVLPSIRACQAGKDVYAEKPLTATISEGRALVNAARKHKRIFQVGTQQRSMEMNDFACAFVRNGGLGKVHTVQCCNYPGPGVYTGLPEDPIPQGLDWDMWVGPTELRPYSSRLQFGWMGWRDYSGGEMTNWGAHGMDQVQWALGTSQTGPVELTPVTPGPNGKVTLRYANGVVVKIELDGGPMGGAVFHGEKGTMTIDRNFFAADPATLVADAPPAAAAEKWKAADWPANYHIRNWVMCIKSRKLPAADVEIGHRSVSVCHLVNIVREIGRPLAWDPEKEVFTGDAEANAYLARPRRAAYALPEV